MPLIIKNMQEQLTFINTSKISLSSKALYDHIQPVSMHPVKWTKLSIHKKYMTLLAC